MQPASKQNNYHYNTKLQAYANRLRKNMTKAEACLWKYVLSRRQMLGFQFLRQRPVLNYIADFMCKDLLLIIEVDGMSHDSEEAQRKDKIRQSALEKIGFTVLRFSNWEVLHEMDEVSILIVEWIKKQGVTAKPRPRDKKKE